MDVRLRGLEIPSNDIRRWCEIYAAGRTADSGRSDDPADLATRVNAEPSSPDCIRLGAWSGEHLIGVAEARRDGNGGAFSRIYVDAPHRRMGAGRLLANATIAWAAERGCRRLAATVIAGTAGEPFADALGAIVEIRLVAVVRHLDAPAPAIETPTGLRLLRWTDHTPTELLAASVRLRRAVGDAPDAHLQINVDHRTAQWVRQWERDRTADGNELRVCAAVVEATGELVGFTEAEVPAAGTADQHDTAVLPAWRGRGIAAWIKADMIGWLRADRPDVDRLTSTINQRNEPMLRVCAALGFREEWRRHLVGVAIG